MGGENRQALAQLDAAGGSSPRGRGKRQLPTKVVYARGLIPAWAGKTRQRVNCVTFGWAHPRVGGENPSGLSLGDDSSGSSPRGRGKLTLRHLPGPSGRLIPAWAGKTSRTMAASAASRAHPRVGGENGSGAVLLLDQSGSSPRGRGKPRQVRQEREHGVLIPAWAGKTLMVSAAGSVMPAHPRVGGENKPDQ